MHACVRVCVCTSQTLDKSFVSSKTGKTKPGWDYILMVQWWVECHIGIIQENVLWQSSLVFSPIQTFNNGLNKGVVCFKYSWSIYEVGMMSGDLYALYDLRI